MFRPLRHALDQVVTTGYLRLIDAKGCAFAFGDLSGAPVVARIADARTERRLFFNPALALGEAYMDGSLVMERGTIYDFLELLLSNLDYAHWPRWARSVETFRFTGRWLRQFNPRPRAKRNVEHHYDLDSGLYELFLDSDRQYSCAYFEQESMTLEEAQTAKKRHLAAKLNLRDGMKVLDIGSGWGGLALYLAKTAHVEVTGITLSEEQRKIAEERARAEGLSNAISFKLCDYRELDGQFDRIVSVGMFEHVGIAHYRRFFARMGELLTEGRRGPAPLDRTVRRPSLDQSLHRQVYLPRRLQPRLERSASGGRAQRPSCHRRRDPAAPLRAHLAPLAPALPRLMAQCGRASMANASAACGSSISLAPKPGSATRT